MVARRVSILRAAATGAALLVPALVLGACDNAPPAPQAEQTEIPDELQAEPLAPPDGALSQGIGTPMGERLATIGLVNKRNNITREIEMYPGESRRIDDVIIRLSACERTAPWEDRQMTGGFVQVLVNERRDGESEPQWYRIFSGWLFRESPSLNVMEHPIYDVWLKDCAMRFPGEEEAAAPPSADS